MDFLVPRQKRITGKWYSPEDTYWHRESCYWGYWLMTDSFRPYFTRRVYSWEGVMLRVAETSLEGWIWLEWVSPECYYEAASSFYSRSHRGWSGMLAVWDYA